MSCGLIESYKFAGQPLKMLKAKRCLFGRPDQDEIRAEQRRMYREMGEVSDEASRRWNFDFATGTPLLGKFKWLTVSNPSDVHPAYRRSVTAGVCAPLSSTTESNNNNDTSSSDVEHELENRNLGHPDIDQLPGNCTDVRQSRIQEYYPSSKSREASKKRPSTTGNAKSPKRHRQSKAL